MAPRKKTTRASQLHPQPQPTHSDYDTDTAVTDTAVADAAPTMQVPPNRTNTELNLLVLRRYIPSIDCILAIAPFAVVYLFSSETQQWEKSGHEGTLFVCQLNAEETGYVRYSVVILNRKSLDNFITELVSGEDIEITEQYVIIQVIGGDGTPSIYGLWIFSDDENAPHSKEIVANAIQECVVRAENARVDGSNGRGSSPSNNLDGTADDEPEDDYTPVQRQQSGQQIDLLSLFDKPSNSSGQFAVQQPLQQPSTETARFSSTPDTDFFRTSDSPAMSQPPHHRQPPSQQNALLDLFKSAKAG